MRARKIEGLNRTSRKVKAWWGVKKWERQKVRPGGRGAFTVLVT